MANVLKIRVISIDELKQEFSFFYILLVAKFSELPKQILSITGQ